MKIKEYKTIPRHMKDQISWDISRRRFIKSIMAAGVFSQVSFLESCIAKQGDEEYLSTKQFVILTEVQNILFPKDDNGPGALDFNAQYYILWVLSDKRLDPEENQYIVNGIDWVEETALETHNKSFIELDKKEQVTLINKISETNWGESWLSVQLTFIFEAMISDPIYGFNKSAIGWQWLEHEAGYPRPTKALSYAQVFETVRKNHL